MTIRLVHDVISAGSLDEASGRFLAKIKAQFVGYSVVDVLASAIALTGAPCRANDFI